jgi:hypothetical protein
LQDVGKLRPGFLEPSSEGAGFALQVSFKSTFLLERRLAQRGAIGSPQPVAPGVRSEDDAVILCIAALTHRRRFFVHRERIEEHVESLVRIACLHVAAERLRPTRTGAVDPHYQQLGSAIQVMLVALIVREDFIQQTGCMEIARVNPDQRRRIRIKDGNRFKVAIARVEPEQRLARRKQRRFRAIDAAVEVERQFVRP